MSHYCASAEAKGRIRNALRRKQMKNHPDPGTATELDHSTVPVAGGWIPCSERLPKAEVAVLFMNVYESGPQLCFGYKERDDPDHLAWLDMLETDRDGAYTDVYRVTHWMPLPPPPGAPQSAHESSADGRGRVPPDLEKGSVKVIDLDAESWKQIKDAASKSPWIPPEYYMNDWVSDVCAFLSAPPPKESGYVRALLNYVRHGKSGGPICASMKHSDYPCDCGLDELLSASGEKG